MRTLAKNIANGRCSIEQRNALTYQCVPGYGPLSRSAVYPRNEEPLEVDAIMFAMELKVSPVTYKNSPFFVF